MTEDRRFFSGDTLAQALNQAAQHLEVHPSEIKYKQLEKRHGFLKVRRKVVIKVLEATAQQDEETGAAVDTQPEEGPAGSSDSLKEEFKPPTGAISKAEENPKMSELDSDAFRGPMLEPDEADVEPAEESPRAGGGLFSAPSEFAAPVSLSPEPEPEPEAPIEEAPTEKESVAKTGDGDSEPASPFGAHEPVSKRRPLATGEEAEAAKKALGLILELADLELATEIRQGDERLEVEFAGDHQGILLRDRGRLLLAIQHLLPRVVRGLIGRSVVCRVDCDDFHEIREERLRDLAQRAADEVRDGGKQKALEPMSPDERRIVHLTLADYPGVETESQGSGLFKRVTVRKIRSGSDAGSAEGAGERGRGRGRGRSRGRRRSSKS